MTDPTDRPGSDTDAPSATASSPDADAPPADDSTLDWWRRFVDRRTPDVSRRSVLKAGGATAGLGVVGAVARRWYPFGVGIPGHVRPPGDPPALPASLDDDCETESYTRLVQPADEVHWGTFPDDAGRPAFELRVAAPTYERGDTVEVTLTNVSLRPREIGQVSVRHNVEVLIDDGWRDVRIVEGDEGQLPQVGTTTGFPGRVETWSFPLTAAGVLDLHGAASSMQVCPDLPVGRYRFVCSAVGRWDDGVAVAFDVVG